MIFYINLNKEFFLILNQTPLFKFVQNNSVDLVELLLKQNGIDINQSDEIFIVNILNCF